MLAQAGCEYAALMHAFRAAIESGDINAAVELLADDVEFRSPAVFTPYRGKAAAATLLHAVFVVFEDFRYVREIGADDARDHALVFEARVGDKMVEGCDFLHVNDDGLIDALAEALVDVWYKLRIPLKKPTLAAE